jgi:hypothetical protein
MHGRVHTSLRVGSNRGTRANSVAVSSMVKLNPNRNGVYKVYFYFIFGRLEVVLPVASA